MYVLTSKEMREVDRITIQEYGIAGVVLMEHAGKACAEEAEKITQKSRAKFAVFCGTGNNGGDGYVAARHLMNRGHEVKVFVIGAPERIKGDALINYSILKKMEADIKIIKDESDLKEPPQVWREFDCVIDAVFGTGLNAPVIGLPLKVINLINSLRKEGKKILSVDIPSGLDADTGAPLGASVNADLTVTFGFLKRCFVTFSGAEIAGEVKVADISVHAVLPERMGFKTRLLEQSDIKKLFSPRRKDAHKGNFGHCLVIAGSAGKPGAALMASISAYRSGAGLVTLATTPLALRAVEGKIAEVMYESFSKTENPTLRDFQKLKALCDGKDAVLVGPGIPPTHIMGELLSDALRSIDAPFIIDADGLNVLVGKLDVLKEAKGNIVITPHPGEMARLAEIKVHEVQKDRPGVASDFAKKYRVTVVLKGAMTVIASPEGDIAVNPTGNPGMASGGMGDVLSGIIVSLLGQGFKPYDASCCGVYIHGRAGDVANRKQGETSLIAGDVIDALPDIFKELLKK